MTENPTDTAPETTTLAEELRTNPLVVTLDRFEGPLDLLLFFIKRDEIDIYDIPIARITEEFLAYTHAMKMLSLEQAGEFIVMAAELMRIKAQMLLPKEERPETDEPEDDPRADLVRRLLEYKQYKEVAESLRGREDEYRDLGYRGYFRADERVVEEPSAEEILSSVSLFRLLAAYKRAIERAPKSGAGSLVIEQVSWTVEEQAEFILDAIYRKRQIPLAELFEGRERMWITVTFLALLELIKNGRIGFHQETGETVDEGEVVLYEK